MANADKEILGIFFDRLLNSDKAYWEYEFDNYALSPSYGDSDEVELQRRDNWQDAFFQVAGEQAVLTGEKTSDQLQRKGYKPVEAPEAIITAASRYGVQNAASVLSLDEMVGREVTEPSPDAQAAVDFVWDVIESVGLTNGKTKPPVRCFTSILDGGTMLNGYWRNGVVYINSDLGGSSSEFGGSLSNRLVKVALEEVAHHCTGATDNSRDFQDYLLELSTKLSRLHLRRKETA